MKDPNASKGVLFSLFVLAALLIGGVGAGGYAGYKAIANNGVTMRDPAGTIISDIAHRQYVACKEIPYDERNKMHWDIIMPYEQQYWDIYDQRNDPNLHPSYLEDMKAREPYIKMFPKEEYPSVEERMNMPWVNTFKPGQFSGVVYDSN